MAAQCYASDGLVWIHVPGIASFSFDDQGGDVTAIVESSHAEADIRALYGRVVAPLVLAARGRQVFHASAVRSPGGVVALCGTSGTGKSTLAYALGRRGYPAWADDAVCVSFLQPGVTTVTALPFELRLQPSVREFLGHVDAHPMSSPSAVEETPDPLAAVVLLRRATDVVGSHPAAMTRLAPAEAFTGTLEHAYVVDLHDRDRRRRFVEDYLRLVACTSVYALTFRPGLQHLSDVLDVLEDELQLEPPR